MKRHGSGPMGGDGGQGSSPRKGVDSARRRLDAEGRRRSEAAEAVDGHLRGPRVDGSRGRRCPALPAQAPLNESKRRRDVPILWPGLVTNLHANRPKRRQLSRETVGAPS